jgi:mannan endo-1,4-beta-mannosidase
MRLPAFFSISVLLYAVLMYCHAGAQAPGFQVKGRHLYDRCGERVILRGVNKMITWTDRSGSSFSEIAESGANSVRIVMVSGDNGSDLDRWATECLAHNMIPMVENHSATGNWGGLGGVVDWWCNSDRVEAIQKHEQYLLLNIANECGQNVSEEDFRTEYASAVTRMREAGIHVPLIIDASGYGQNIDMLQAAGPYLISQDPDSNLLFSIHMWWPSEWRGEDVDQQVIDELQESVDMGLPLIVGEFAHKAVNCTPAIPYLTIIEHCQLQEVGWLAWSWGPGNGDCGEMDMTPDGTFESLDDWGLEVAVTDPNSISNTSVRPYFIENGECNPVSIEKPERKNLHNRERRSSPVLYNLLGQEMNGLFINKTDNLFIPFELPLDSGFSLKIGNLRKEN